MDDIVYSLFFFSSSFFFSLVLYFPFYLGTKMLIVRGEKDDEEKE
jgi:hypothetical protein